ncbi:hypothetical protein [Streptomyces sp. NPDC059378]|uniref:hypothetical protein n=1 Tax=Streptomyces sp. NPDC059378 TaxID=3346815 RepID=UPI0036A87E3F
MSERTDLGPRADATEMPPDLSFTTPGGLRHRAPARFGPELRRVVRPPLLARELLLGDAWKGVQVRLSSADVRDPHEYQALEAEVGAALTIHRAFLGSPYQGLFPVPVGYDMDAAEPFLIYATPRGEPATGLTHGISTTDQRIIERDLVLAVRLLEGLGLVHRGIVPAAVRWDGERAQLWDVGATARIGAPRTPWGAAPYASPEQRAGVGEADARDALWSTAQLMYQLVAGRQGRPDGPPADLDAYRSLAQSVGDAFAPRAEDRPTPARLLGLLVPDPDPATVLMAGPDPLEPYRREFDDRLARKREAVGIDGHADHMQPIDHMQHIEYLGPTGAGGQGGPGRAGDPGASVADGYGGPPDGGPRDTPKPSDQERGWLRGWLGGGTDRERGRNGRGRR